MHRDKSQQGESGTVRGDAQIHDFSQAARPIETEMNGFPPTPTACHAPDVIAPSAYIVLLVYIHPFGPRVSDHFSRLFKAMATLCPPLCFKWTVFFLFLGTMPSHSGVHFNSLVVFFKRKSKFNRIFLN